MIVRLFLAGLLLAHGAIHAGYLSRRPPPTPEAPPWPFDLDRSWLFTRLGAEPRVVRAIGRALVVATIGAYALAALATVGVLPGSAWGATVVAGSLASLALLLLFFHRWLVAGIAIDLVLLWVALVAGWTPEALG
jgi:hypothetical protein